MSAVLIAAIVVFVLALFGRGYLWLVRVSRSARYRAYQETSRAAVRNYRGNSESRRGSEWR